jgi:hypothetical protein
MEKRWWFAPLLKILNAGNLMGALSTPFSTASQSNPNMSQCLVFISDLPEPKSAFSQPQLRPLSAHFDSFSASFNFSRLERIVATFFCKLLSVLFAFHTYVSSSLLSSLGRPIREGVSTDSLKFHMGPPCPTLIRPAGGPPPKRPSSSPLDTPCRTGLSLGLPLSSWAHLIESRLHLFSIGTFRVRL